MAYEQRDNSGSLFKNDKRTDEKHPHYKGTAMINGEEFWISAWMKEGKSGVKFMSLAFQPKEEGAATSNSSKKEADDEDGMPF
jgi:hypothetical protein